MTTEPRIAELHEFTAVSVKGVVWLAVGFGLLKYVLSTLGQITSPEIGFPPAVPVHVQIIDIPGFLAARRQQDFACLSCSQFCVGMTAWFSTRPRPCNSTRSALAPVRRSSAVAMGPVLPSTSTVPSARSSATCPQASPPVASRTWARIEAAVCGWLCGCAGNNCGPPSVKTPRVRT